MNPAHDVTTRDLLRIALLGLNAWLVVMVVPSIHVGLSSPADLALMALPLAVLASGAAVFRHRISLARWILLAVFPTSLGAIAASRPELSLRDAYGTVGVALAALSLLAFLAVTAHAVAIEKRQRTTSVQPVIGKEPVQEPEVRRLLRRGLLWATGVGAFGLAVVAPTLGDRSERAAIWGEAADDAAVLTSVVAAVVAAVALGTLIGPGLRASRERRNEKREKTRLAAAFLIAAAAGAGWIALHYFDQAG